MKKVLLIVALTVSLGLLGSFFVAPASAFLPGLPGLPGLGGGGCSYAPAPCYVGWYGCGPAWCCPAPCVVKAKKAKKAAPAKKDKK